METNGRIVQISSAQNQELDIIQIAYKFEELLMKSHILVAMIYLVYLEEKGIGEKYRVIFQKAIDEVLKKSQVCR